MKNQNCVCLWYPTGCSEVYTIWIETWNLAYLLRKKILQVVSDAARLAIGSKTGISNGTGNVDLLSVGNRCPDWKTLLRDPVTGKVTMVKPQRSQLNVSLQRQSVLSSQGLTSQCQGQHGEDELDTQFLCALQAQSRADVCRARGLSTAAFREHALKRQSYLLSIYAFSNPKSSKSEKPG